jgi:hypothetical protein
MIFNIHSGGSERTDPRVTRVHQRNGRQRNARRSDCEAEPLCLTALEVGLGDIQVHGDSTGGNRRKELDELIASVRDFRDAALLSPIMLKRKIAKLVAGEFPVTAHIEAGGVVRGLTLRCARPGSSR